MTVELERELTDLRRSILAMGAAVEQRVRMVAAALRDHDVVPARTVREGDDEIDEMDLGIEAECLQILALSQPVAGDLRFVLAVMRINSDLERIGDCAKSMGKRILSLERGTAIELPPGLLEMADRTRRMLADALGALAKNDVDLAGSVRRADDRVDELQKELFAWGTRTIPRHVETTSSAIDVLSIARQLERAADLSTNIAEDVLFIVEGEVVRHDRTRGGG